MKKLILTAALMAATTANAASWVMTPTGNRKLDNFTTDYLTNNHSPIADRALENAAILATTIYWFDELNSICIVNVTTSLGIDPTKTGKMVAVFGDSSIVRTVRYVTNTNYLKCEDTYKLAMRENFKEFKHTIEKNTK